MFYNINQNNSGGSFVVDNKLCHRLFIEADSEQEALDKAEELGCYWDGVSEGMDCFCCGDRWSKYTNVIDLDKYKEEGYEVSVYSHYENTEKVWQQKYGSYTIVEEPHWVETWGSRSVEGKISFKNIEEYAQFMADKYGWTVPDCRIYYKNGKVVEIFMKGEE